MKKLPQKSQKSLKKKGRLTSDSMASPAPVTQEQVSAAPVASAEDQAKKLEEVSAQIAREKALQEKETADKKLQEDQKLSASPLPSLPPETGLNIELSPAFKKVGAGVSFYVLTWIVETFFKRGVKPLTDKQQADLEAAVDRLAQKYMPIFMAKFMSQHQQESDLVCVLAGIGFDNNAPLAPKYNLQAAAPDKAPIVPPIPEANVTVITAQAPPLTGAN